MRKQVGDIYYDRVKHGAVWWKIHLQMMIGLAIIVLLALKIVLHVAGAEPETWQDACPYRLFARISLVLLGNHPLKIVGYSLALSAGVELAHMLFTPGPDEAVEPLILGLASAVLLTISQDDIVEWDIALTIVVLIGGLATLFWVRERFIETREQDDVGPAGG